METISVRDAQNRLAELAHEVKDGESIAVTRNGQPVFEVAAQPKHKGVDFEAGQAYLRSKGITNPVPYIADDFDDPLPEDFLLRPLP
jgi:antitoxin (DNA-binding transcriptional repressor) of toxin-antitoxin stability system